MHALGFQSSRDAWWKCSRELHGFQMALGVDWGLDKLTGDEWNTGKGFKMV